MHIFYVYQKLKCEFKIRDVNSNNFVGFEYNYDIENGIVYLNQSKYLLRKHKLFNMHNAKPKSTPLDKSIKLEPAKDSGELSDFPYRQAIGALLYVAVKCRPDISYVISPLSRFLDRPSNTHVKARG